MCASEVEIVCQCIHGVTLRFIVKAIVKFLVIHDSKIASIDNGCEWTLKVRSDIGYSGLFN